MTLYRKILSLSQLHRKTNKKFSFSTLSSYLVIPGVVLLLIVLWVRSQAIDFNRHNDYVIKLRRTQELDARIKQNVLQARYGLLTYYDPIVKDIAELHKLQTELQQPPAFITPAGREELSELLSAYIKLWQQKEQFIEKFQSQNAILRNSLTYFPIAISDLVRENTTPPGLASRLQTLLRDILLFNLSTDEALMPRIEGEMQQILKDYRTTANSADLNMAIAHARIILNQRSRVNNQVQTIVTLPTAEGSESLAQAYDRSYQQALNTRNAYRLWLYLLSFVLLVGIATWIILRLKASASATRQAEEKYRSIFENSVAGIFQTTPDGRYLSANPTLATMYGYESAAKLIQNITDIARQLYVVPQQRAEFVRLLQEKGAVADFELQVYRQDRQTIWISQNARAVCDRQGKLLYYEGTVTDITARKRAEAALQASEAELRLLFAAMTDTVVVFDSTGRYLQYIHTQSLDYKPSIKRIGKTVHEVLPKEIADLFVVAIRQALYLHEQSTNLIDCLESTPLSQRSIQVEYSLPIRGQKIWFSANVSPLTEHTVLWVARNISDRKHIESALRSSEAKFASAFRSSPHPIIISTLDEGRLIEVNDSFCRMTGYSMEEALGRTRDELDLWVDLAERSRIVQLIRATGAIQNQEIEIRTKSGEVRTVLFSAETIELNGQTRVLWACNDISDRKLAEAALERAKEAAEVANRAKSQFLSHMSHELRTPLSVILGFTQLLTRSSALDPKQQEYLDAISRSGEHLLALINDVLELSKIEADRITPNEQDFNLHHLLDGLQQMFQFKATSKGLQFTVERSPDLPQFIRTDESKLRQVLVNLLGNAIKFTPTGSVILRVGLDEEDKRAVGRSPSQRMGAEEEHQSKIQSGRSGNSLPDISRINLKSKIASLLTFSVEDTGVGIAAEEFDRLFEPFAQTEAGLKSQEGTGLGLPIARRFVQVMGGDITVESRWGEGTCFRFGIPVERTEADAIAPPTSTQQVIRLAPAQPTYRILVVEDKPSNRQLLVELLKPVGFDVREAQHGQEAIALCRDWSPHLIWMDLRMPVMDGYEATKQIKSFQQPIIIALTGSAFEEERRVAIAAGCDDFVRKPFRTEVIFEKIAQYLGVRYIYAEPAQLPPSVVLPHREADPSSLAVMPAAWIEQLHQAATCVNAKLLHQLVAQIPPEQAPLAEAIARSIDNFQFEEIVALTKGQLESEK